MTDPITPRLKAERLYGARDLLGYLVGTEHLTDAEKWHVEQAAGDYFKQRKQGVER